MNTTAGEISQWDSGYHPKKTSKSTPPWHSLACRSRFLELVKQMAARENVTEQLKAQNQMLWVQRMNNIRDRAVEVVNNDLIYA